MCLPQLFRNQAKQTPEAVAVVDGDRAMTYAELDQATDNLAGYLQNLGICFDESAGIFMETCLEYFIAYIAILKAGGAYIPLDLAYPDALVKKIVDEAKPRAVLSKNRHRHRLYPDLSPPILSMDVDNTWQNGIYDPDAALPIRS